MNGRYQVRYTDSARIDLVRLFDILLARASSADDLDHAQPAIDSLTASVEGSLSRSPFIYRKAGNSPFLRELIVPFGGAGYVVLYEIEPESLVNVVAIRHQLEDDFF